ncbi:pur operon repressor [Eubacteriaceae bacterium ES3]|nr:pur operon repressor [Eubacteriaceae bacterium ES3]
MMKKNERISIITKILADHPNEVFSYNYFAKLLDAGKSSVCEDIAIVKEAFLKLNEGRVHTFSGASGGVVYYPEVSEQESKRILLEIAELLKEPRRQIHGGFVYYSDILSNPRYSKNIGRIIASRYFEKGIDYVVTTETKGIPTAMEAAHFLNVPVVLIRRSNRVTEGSTISVNYISGSSNKISTMYLSRRIDLNQKKVLIIDDFMKGGGTAKGMVSLMEEVGAEVCDVSVIFATRTPQEKLISTFTPLLIVDDEQLGEGKLMIEIYETGV